jgi:glycosyltransferase involved in cell wall biosynthesis
MRFLIVNNHCISDPTVGAVRSLRTLARWLLDAGHDCRVLTTARFEDPHITVFDHLNWLGIPTERTRPRRAKNARHRPPAECRVIRYRLDGIPITLLVTRHNDEQSPDRQEARQFLALFGELLRAFSPDQVIAMNGHPMIQHVLEAARTCGITTVFTLRSHGYFDARFFEHVNYVFTTSQYLTNVYREKVGLDSTPIDSPIEWSEVVAPEESRAFVTFVNPSLHKGVLLFARLAQMLGDARPDIPILVVQSGYDAGALNQIPGIDFTKYPQIMASPAVKKPAEFFALSRLLLVPSVWAEPLGRVAIEAMINGIPPLVSDRGGLADSIGGDFSKGGGGRVLGVPDWITPESIRVPSADDLRHWFDAVCELWDDPAFYTAVAARARAIALERYSEDVLRRRHVEYLTSLRPDSRKSVVVSQGGIHPA